MFNSCQSYFALFVISNLLIVASNPLCSPWAECLNGISVLLLQFPFDVDVLVMNAKHLEECVFSDACVVVEAFVGILLLEVMHVLQAFD